jgi:cellulose biosynthesis protein BcsQ
VETVAFYSYKGGVGRSLLLANAARFLATLGKGVVALDFDFEAPGLHYKLGGSRTELRNPEIRGVVPYLVATAEGTVSPPPLDAHLTSIPLPPDAQGWLKLMPAGPAPHPAYWTALKELGDKLRLEDPSGQGMMALLDLKARIQEELQPDYLLIDARTGVTELGGLATTILADTVVCMYVPNQESLDGTLTVVEALKAAPRLKKQRPIRVVPVLSRATATIPESATFIKGVRRLLELGDGTKGEGNKESPPFALPHDDIVGASDRVVGGEQTASAFSPLYKAYLELFQALFPVGAEAAKGVLERLVAIDGVKENLTRDGSNDGEQTLGPWSPAAIAEGVLVEAEGYPGGTRYADLVCLGPDARPLLIVEYAADEASDEAIKFWSKVKSVRCVVLLIRQENRSVKRRIFTRPHGGELRPVDRWDIPRPREFELFPDVGDRSIESMLNALRHGHAEAVEWLITEWRESAIAVDMHPKMFRGHWRPERARRILEGLAATEDLMCGEEILRRALPNGSYCRRVARRFRDDWEFSPEVDRRMAEDLFAPLFWRLPVEAVVKAMRPRRHPGERLSLAGYRFLANELMGLRYDPDVRVLEDARVLSARIPLPAGREDSEDERALIWLHRGHGRLFDHIELSDEVPPALVWEEAWRKDPYWSGTLEEARKQFGKELTNTLAKRGNLRNRLRTFATQRALVIQGLLGSYDASGHIELYPSVITAAAEVLGQSPRHLKSLVFMHLSVWSVAHQATDLDGQLGFGFAPTDQSTPFTRESPTHVMIVQSFTDHLIQRLQDPGLRTAFEALSRHQPEPYTGWRKMRRLPLEKLRALLLKARASAPALGLPGGNSQ